MNYSEYIITLQDEIDEKWLGSALRQKEKYQLNLLENVHVQETISYIQLKKYKYVSINIDTYHVSYIYTLT